MGYPQITSIGTHKCIHHEFGQEITYVYCEMEEGNVGAMGQTFREGSRGAN